MGASQEPGPACAPHSSWGAPQGSGGRRGLAGGRGTGWRTAHQVRDVGGGGACSRRRTERGGSPHGSRAVATLIGPPSSGALSFPEVYSVSFLLSFWGQKRVLA